MSEGEIKVVHASIEQAAAEIAALQEMALALVPVETGMSESSGPGREALDQVAEALEGVVSSLAALLGRSRALVMDADSSCQEADAAGAAVMEGIS